MNHELAKTLTTALVQFIDKERPEGTMCCSNTECDALERAFMAEDFSYVEALVQKKLSRLTEFEQALAELVNDVLAKEPQNPSVWIVGSGWADKLLAIAKKELARRDEVITLDNLPPYDKGFQDGKAEAMAYLERTYFCNPDKLPKWLTDDIARKELNAHTKGYNKGYKDAEKKIFSHGEGTYFYSKDRDVTYISPMPVSTPAIPIMPTTPSGWGCDGTHCTNPHGDCINCPRRFSSGGTITTPNTASGTSTLKAEG